MKYNYSDEPEAAGLRFDNMKKQDTDSTQPTEAVNFTFFVAYMAALSAFGSFVNDMFVPAMPEMRDSFGCSVSTIQLGLTMGMVGLAIGQLVLGPVSDKYGRKPTLMWSLAVFMIAGIVSVFSPDVCFFLVCRFVQGLGASGGYFLARTIPTDLYSGRMLAKTMALIGAINGIAPATAPVLGGFVAHAWGWQAVFVFLTVIALAVFAFAPRMKESLPYERRNHGTLLGAFRNYGTMLRNRRFMVHTLLKGTALGILFAYVSSATFIIQRHFGYSEIHFGLIVGVNALFVVLGSMLALKFKMLKTAGFAGAIILIVSVTALGVVLFFFNDSFILYEICLVPMLFGLGMLFSMSNTLAMNEGRSDAGVASAILGITGYVFGAIVPPLTGLNGVLQASAIVIFSLGVLVVIFAVMSWKIPADLDSGTTGGSPAPESRQPQVRKKNSKFAEFLQNPVKCNQNQ